MKSIVIILAVLTAAVALAADPPVQVEAVPAPPVDQPAPTRELSPMMMDIQAAMEAARLQVADLRSRYLAAVSDEEAMDLMREAARVKRESRIEMMRIQLRYARLNGNDERVAELEEIVARMTAPPRKGEPIPRNDRNN